MSIKKISLIRMAEMFGYGGKSNCSNAFNAWSKSDRKEHHDRLEALKIGAVFLENGYDLETSLNLLNINVDQDKKYKTMIANLTAKNSELKNELSKEIDKRNNLELEMHDIADKLEGLKGIRA